MGEGCNNRLDANYCFHVCCSFPSPIRKCTNGGGREGVTAQLFGASIVLINTLTQGIKAYNIDLWVFHLARQSFHKEREEL